MTEINFYGDIFSQTGYCSHTRQLLNALHKINPLIHFETGYKPPNWIRWVNSSELLMMESDEFLNSPQISIDLPPFWNFHLSRKPSQFIGWCVWEGINIPKYWSKTLLKEEVTHIITPSQHSRTAILNTCPEAENKLLVIPHGVDNKLFSPNGTKNDKFTFIANKGWSQGINDRGGIQWLLKAFSDEFSSDSDVELLVKVNSAYNTPEWNLTNELTKIGITPDMAKNIKFIPNNIEYKHLPKVYNQGHVFVSPTMGDAFNLPCLEAMSCGLPVIATNFGGQTDYVTNENGWLIDYELVDVKTDLNYEGNKWAMPNLQHLRKLMRYAFDNRKEVTEKGLKSLETAKKYSWDNSAQSLLKIINGRT